LIFLEEFVPKMADCGLAIIGNKGKLAEIHFISAAIHNTRYKNGKNMFHPSDRIIAKSKGFTANPKRICEFCYTKTFRKNKIFLDFSL